MSLALQIEDDPTLIEYETTNFLESAHSFLFEPRGREGDGKAQRGGKTRSDLRTIVRAQQERNTLPIPPEFCSSENRYLARQISNFSLMSGTGTPSYHNSSQRRARTCVGKLV